MIVKSENPYPSSSTTSTTATKEIDATIMEITVEDHGQKAKNEDSYSFSTNGSRRRRRRLHVLDGLRGILCCIVVIHHWRCGFQPCSIFGPSVQWLLDFSLTCDSSQTRPFFWLGPFVNGPFAVAVFFVMSGTVLSLPFIPSPRNDDSVDQRRKWALAVVKRYFRLAIPVAVAVFFAYIIAGFTTFHEDTAKSTQSWWLYNFNCRAPPTLFDLLKQMAIGVWHGSCTLNNAIWTMKIELFGSFLVYLLVAILQDMRSSLLAKRMLGVLFIFMLVPSNTQFSKQSVQLEWIDKEDSRINNGVEPSVQIVKFNPGTHTALLEKLNIPLTVKQVQEEKPPGTLLDTGIFVKNSNADVSNEEKTSTKSLDDNISLVRQLIAMSSNDDESKTRRERQLQYRRYTLNELQYSKSFGPDVNPWTYYAGFVSGTWIAVDMTTVTPSSSMPCSWNWIDVVELVVAFVCSTFPYSSIWTEHHMVWQGMNLMTDSMQIGSSNSMALWHIIGASCLVHLVVRRRNHLLVRFLGHPLAVWLGKISFALYLIHIPILYTITCFWYNKFRVFNTTPWTQNNAALTALLLTIPAMILVASGFERYVDRPAIYFSSLIGKRIMGTERSRKSSREITA